MIKVLTLTKDKIKITIKYDNRDVHTHLSYVYTHFITPKLFTPHVFRIRIETFGKQFFVYLNGLYESDFDNKFDLINYCEFLIMKIFASHKNYLSFHAASLIFKDILIVLFGQGGSGKSTVSGALLKTPGITFLTDELTLIEGNRVIPFPRLILQKKSEGNISDKNILFHFDKRNYIFVEKKKISKSVKVRKKYLFFLDYRQDESSIKASHLNRTEMFHYLISNMHLQKGLASTRKFDQLIDMATTGALSIKYQKTDAIVNLIKQEIGI